ncbi:MAG: penicillin acylase family protein, partial [Thermoanaerobaculia bacterium]
MRKLLVVSLTLLCAAAAGLALLSASTFPRQKGERRVEGLSAPVSIERDASGVPTIRAASGSDVLFGLGYAHAQDRLWQMEYQRRVGSGRLAEALGGRLVETDRFLRTVGFRRAAEAAWPALSRETRGLIEAYTRGINAFLATDRARQVEFRILRVDPEPFSPVDSLTWSKMMAWDLAGNARDEIRRARFLAAVGPERTRELLPPVPEHPTILLDEEWMSAGSSPASSPVSRLPSPVSGPSPVSPLPTSVPRSSSVSRLPSPVPWSSLENVFALLSALGFNGEQIGSNSWVVGGSRTKSGKPLLANDPHLGLRTPSVWYLARLEAPGLSVAGATLPGVPGVIIGHNARIAWGLTSVEPDVQDLYLEEADPKTFETRTERIRVRGAEDVVIEVRSSRHGPIVTDVLDGAAALGRPVALRWAGLDPGDTTAEAFLGINRASNWEEFLAAARHLRAPAQNLVYADVDGHIGYTTTGAIPMRPRSDGLLPVSGAGQDDWNGYIPFEKLPRALDPPRGYVATANNRVVSERYPWPITHDWPEPYRADRITRRILAEEKLGIEEMRAIQLDRHSEQADELLPLLLDTVPANALSRDALARLKAWDRDFAPDSVPASIYAAWYTALSAMPEDELAGVPAGSVRSRFLINALQSNSAWCDDVGTAVRETCAGFKTATLSKAVADLRRRLGPDTAAWRWERLHLARFPHGVFDAVPALRRFFSLEIGQGGDASTVNVGAYRRDGSYVMSDGPSYRQIVDLSDLSKSLFVHTTGQSGNVFAAGYRNLLPLWRRGEYFGIGSTPAAQT